MRFYSDETLIGWQAAQERESDDARYWLFAAIDETDPRAKERYESCAIAAQKACALSGEFARRRLFERIERIASGA